MEIKEVSKKITANSAIISMMGYINSDRKDLFYKTADEYSKTLSTSGDSYYKIRRLINEIPKKLTLLSDLSSDIKKLIIQNPLKDEHVFLNENVKEVVNGLLIEWKNVDTFKFHNVGIRNKILLHGKTGNGKTTIAKHIARMSELPFVEINADQMIDSKLGNSGYNIHQIFNTITEPCILFWDEVDTIGRARGRGGDTAAGLENERMVNSLLVNIEKLNNDVIFIGATNRRDILDSAFIRRFDLQFEIPEPNDQEKRLFAQQTTEYHKLPETYIPDTFSQFNNYSELKLYFIDLARKYILELL